jgi:hypothetical protein
MESATKHRGKLNAEQKAQLEVQKKVLALMWNGCKETIKFALLRMSTTSKPKVARNGRKKKIWER